MTESNQRELLGLIEQRLVVVRAHTDNWTNGSFEQVNLRPVAALKVADLILDMVHTEVSAALNELRMYRGLSKRFDLPTLYTPPMEDGLTAMEAAEESVRIDDIELNPGQQNEENNISGN